MSMMDSVAPPLSIETFVCMADESEFVIRDRWGVIKLRILPDRVRFDHRDQEHCVLVEDLTKPEAKEAWSALGVDRATLPEKLPVEPLRPQCQHYKRVMLPFENDAVIRRVERVCRAQRGESGEYVSLSDQQVLACEHRHPRDFVSEERLRQFDAARVAEGRKTVEEWEPPP
jgi:hypothetical protein